MSSSITATLPNAESAASHTSVDSAASINARIDRLPVTAHLWKLVFLISLGGFFEVYDLIFTGYIAPGMVKSGILETTTHAFFGFHGFGAYVAAMFAGLFVGTFFLGFLPDKYGRRTVFTYSLLWYSVGAAIMALQHTGDGILLWRFVAGIGVGVELMTIDAYVTELVPQHMRGRAMAFNQGVMFAAAPVAAILSYWLVPTTLFELDGWRWVVLIGSVGAVVVWAIRRAVPESPRWLARNERMQEASQILTAIEAKVEAQSGKPLPAPRAPKPTAKTATHSFRELWLPPYRSRMIMLIVFNFFQAIGYYGFANWVPTLLIGQGITVTKSLLYAFIIAFALPIGPLLAMTVADRIQRKYLIVASALAVTVFGLLFSQMRNPLYLIVLGVLISLAGQVISFSFHAYQAELVPTSVRASGAGFVYSTSRIGAMLSGFIIAFLLRNFGVFGVFAGIGGCMLAVIISIGVFGPKTNGLALEELSH